MCATEGAKVIATDMNSSLLEELKGEDPREPHVACARTHSGGGGEKKAYGYNGVFGP